MLRLDSLGVLDVTLGGGEPTLFPHLVEFCRFTWEQTQLGISITTHGHNLTESTLSDLGPNVSQIRFSIDANEPRYSEIRGRPLASVLNIMRAAAKFCRVGMNCVMTPGRAVDVQQVLDLALNEGVTDILIVPQHTAGTPELEAQDWRELERTINSYKSRLSLSVSALASPFLGVRFLDTSTDTEFHFAHLTATMKLQRNSYGGPTFDVDDLSRLESQLAALQL